jgi:hypothetical protein
MALIQIEESALDSLKRMVEELQAEKANLLNASQELLDAVDDWAGIKGHEFAKERNQLRAIVDAAMSKE